MLKTQKLHISEINLDQGQISKRICNISGTNSPTNVSVYVIFFCVANKMFRGNIILQTGHPFTLGVFRIDWAFCVLLAFLPSSKSLCRFGTSELHWESRSCLSNVVSALFGCVCSMPMLWCPLLHHFAMDRSMNVLWGDVNGYALHIGMSHKGTHGMQLSLQTHTSSWANSSCRTPPNQV